MELYIYNTEYVVDETFLDEFNNTVTYNSIAYILQPTIATWYKALTRIALVGLLSVLVYIGVRIVISSASGKENSKYKKMLINWLIALCLLFTLHYIMSAIMVITQKITEVFNSGDTDQLLNILRNKIEKADTWEEIVAEVIMYVLMTIYTIMFSFQYLKRVLYMGFFTMIAPLITLTYPLDKIKDSKAQAFTMWIREYIFNALIPVVHLILYFTLVGSALSLVETYPLYAIIAIGFITQAERIIRKMFGFENTTTVGAMEAAATGGLITAALNKLQKTGNSNKKADDSSENSNNKVRTVSKDLTAGQKLEGGASALVKKYYKKGIRTVVGTGTGITGAIAGFAAGVSQGDISAALAGAAAGRKAGKGISEAVTNINVGNLKNSINNIQDTWNTGAYGEEYAKQAKEMREFKSTSAYEALKDKYKDNLTDDKLRAMLQAGINKQKDMDKVLGSDNMGDAIGYYTLAKKCPDSIYYDKKVLQNYVEELAGQVGLSQKDANTIVENMKKFR